jgi:hypothetical protein
MGASENRHIAIQLAAPGSLSQTNPSRGVGIEPGTFGAALNATIMCSNRVSRRGRIFMCISCVVCRKKAKLRAASWHRFHLLLCKFSIRLSPYLTFAATAKILFATLCEKKRCNAEKYSKVTNVKNVKRGKYTRRNGENIERGACCIYSRVLALQINPFLRLCQQTSANPARASASNL